MAFFELFGIVSFLFVVGWIARILYETFIYKCDLSQFQPSNGKKGWAVVTGCTSGIGEGFAFDLARRGWNILLVSRSEKKLKELAVAIAAKYPKTQTALAISDATDSSMSSIDSVVKAVRGLPEGSFRILINNVGVSTEDPCLFESATLPEIEGMLSVNCRYSTLLTQALLPLLKLKPAQQRGAIVNLSSQSAFVHVPYLTVYSATKAYNLAFSHALRDELQADNIEVLALTPGFVMSAMTKIPEASLGVCTSEVCASSGLNAIGLRDSCGYWYHSVAIKWSMLIPAFIRSQALMKMMPQMAREKQAQLKKAAEALANKQE